MELVNYEGFEVDRCTGCKGIWFDSGERERLKSIKGAESIDTGDEAIGKENNTKANIQCPRCTTPLIRMVDIEQPHIWYESCSVCCGAYFDAGEFRDYKKYTLADIVRGFFARARD